MTTSYDGIILGAGHNGLILQAYLGKAGLKALAWPTVPSWREVRFGKFASAADFARLPKWPERRKFQDLILQ